MKRNFIQLVILMAPLVATLALNQAYAQQAQRTGEITKIDSENKSFVVRTSRGETSILTTENTVFKKGEEEIGFNDLIIGDDLRVLGVRKGADVEAQEVTVQTRVEPPADTMDMM
jgi:hypothetical protein